MKLSGAVFDFDGTLFDTMSVWDTAGEDYLKQCGKVPRENLCEVLKPKSLSGAAEYLKKNYDLPLSVNEIVDGVNKTVGDFYLCEAQPKNGVREFLTALREINVRMCITTAAERKLTEGALKRCGLFGFFDKIFTCGEVGHDKNDPYIYCEALSFIGTKKDETLVFEDAYHAAKTAKGAGFYVAAVYDSREKAPEKMKAVSDIYLNNFLFPSDFINDIKKIK